MKINYLLQKDDDVDDHKTLSHFVQRFFSGPTLTRSRGWMVPLCMCIVVFANEEPHGDGDGGRC